jgi:hypothetical protein
MQNVGIYASYRVVDEVSQNILFRISRIFFYFAKYEKCFSIAKCMKFREISKKQTFCPPMGN